MARARLLNLVPRLRSRIVLGLRREFAGYGVEPRTQDVDALLRVLPRKPGTATSASSVASNAIESCRFAPVICSVDLPLQALVLDPLDVRHQRLVTPRPGAMPSGVTLLGGIAPVSRRGDLRRCVDRLNSKASRCSSRKALTT